MDFLNAGASRPANDGARADHLRAANDLVRQTLARHGLISTGGEGKTPPHGDLQQTISNALAQAGIATSTPLQFRKPGTAIPVPDGAEFRQGSFTGRTGRRDYRTYIPASASEGVTGIVVMLHGCTQTPEDFALGTGMNALAETHRFIVIYPAQSRGDNAQSCWNWFSKGDQRRGRGEPEILAGIARAAMAEHGVPSERCFVAGLSAGAAMAVILGETYPDVFAAVGAHSGLPFGAASDVPSAFAAMAGTPSSERVDQAETGLRTIVFHGDADRTVSPVNSDAIARQAERHGATGAVSTTQTGRANGRRFSRTLTTDRDDAPQTEHWRIEGLGHAWSGGRSEGNYADPAGPDASAEMIRFFFQTAEGTMT
ncbi:PHB depolymerase family esterase [uncultured Marivita sp.]|uniref:extracellular catalytic domain type 1 short-chain-length polyhydroxyalkanoate depolymerase n=1 Tax=uncultured Marivita sp. TaxID=888080 RepID=UPI00261FE7A0|nr:PHB depolymerase family esterase [uncultured Marivita sp.]